MSVQPEGERGFRMSLKVERPLVWVWSGQLLSGRSAIVTREANETVLS